MANDYMAKLAADLEGMSMMRSPKPMTVVYRDAGGDLGGFDYDLLEAADIAADEGFSDTGGANTQGNMDAVDAMAYMQAAIADPNLPTGDQFDSSTPATQAARTLEKEKQEQLELFLLVEQLKNKKPGEQVTSRSGRTLTKADVEARDAERAAKADAQAKDSLPKDNEGKVSYNALFDRYATPEERQMKTEIKNGVTIRTNKVDPPDTSELIDRHYKSLGLVEVKDRAGKTRLSNDPGYGYSKENVYDRLKSNRDEWEDIKFLSSTLPAGARLRDRSGNLLAPFREESISTVGFPIQTLTGYSGPSLSPLAKGGKVDSIQALADSLESYGRKGDTMLAHINPKEAQMLMDKGGAGTINPMTGLPEFYDGDEGGFGDGGYAGSGDFGDDAGGGGGDFDYDYNLEEAADIAAAEQAAEVAYTGAQTPEEQQYNLPPGTLDLVTGVGRGGPGEFSGGPDDRASTIDALDRIFNKEGIPQEFVPYFNSLKDRGLSNEQAMATLAAVAGTPGGAQGLTSGYTDGYSFGGPMGTLEDLIETGQTASLEERAKKAREKQEAKEKEKDEEGVAPASLADYEEPGFMDRFASILGFDDFSLASLNPFTVTPEQQAIMQSYRDQGLTVQQRSDMDNLIGLGIGAALPIQLSGPKFIAEQATDTGIFALATDPATGFEYLIDNSGGLQLAPGQLGDESNQDGGNEPAITKKRKAATEPVEEKDVTKDVNKPSFPQQSLPRFTKGAIENLKISLKDDPEKLAQILQNYSIPDEYSGLRTLV